MSFILWLRSFTFSGVKGAKPVSSSKASTPSDQTSSFSLCGLRWIISGAR